MVISDSTFRFKPYFLGMLFVFTTSSLKNRFNKVATKVIEITIEVSLRQREPEKRGNAT